MPRSEISGENRELGRGLASLLVNNIREVYGVFDANMGIFRSPEPPYLRAALGSTPAYKEIYLADVLVSVEAFTIQERILSHLGMRFPCVRVPGNEAPIPISLGFEALPSAQILSQILSDRAYQGVLEYDGARTFMESLLNIYSGFWGNSAETVLESTLAVPTFFITRLSDFLAVRFNARQSNISANPGTFFTVHCSHGKRVYYTPTYWQQVRHVLHYPSSPATGWIQPARYYFGAAPLGQTPQFDYSAYYDVPPDNQATLPF